MKKAKPNPKAFTSDDFKAWGSIGGKKARGLAKKRPDDHYKRISKLGVEARRTNSKKP